MQATVLIETLPAAFQMNEILWELRAHSVGLNCGRWDYIFSFIKTFREDPNAIMPDRCPLPPYLPTSLHVSYHRASTTSAADVPSTRSKFAMAL